MGLPPPRRTRRNLTRQRRIHIGDLASRDRQCGHLMAFPRMTGKALVDEAQRVEVSAASDACSILVSLRSSWLQL